MATTKTSSLLDSPDLLLTLLSLKTSAAVEELLADLPVVNQTAYLWVDTEPAKGWQFGNLHWIPVGRDRGNAGRIQLAGDPYNPSREVRFPAAPRPVRCLVRALRQTSHGFKVAMCRGLLLLGVGLPVLLHAQNTGRGSAMVLNHVAVVDVAQSVVPPDMAIVIRGARIVAIDRPNGARVPRDAQVLDLDGKFAIPVLIDMHNHVGSGANIPGPPVAGEPSARDPRHELKRLLALGFTTVFATAYPNVGEFVELRKAANDDSAPLPRFFGAARGSTAVGGHSSQPRFNAFLPNTTDQARADVREMKALGVDAIKVTYSDQAHTGRASLPVMRPELMQAIIAEAHAVGSKTYVHAPTLAHAKEVLRAGADGLAHSVADAPVDDELIGLMRKNQATYTTTLALYTSFADVAAWMRRLEAIDQRHVVAPGVFERYKSPAGAKAYHAFFGTFPPQNLQHARANARRLFEGIPVLAGTDTGVTGVLLGVSSQMELVLLVEAGLTPAEALCAPTMGPARAWGRDGDLGTLEPGKLADLVILDADPLTDIRNIVKVSRVIKDGNLYEPGQLIDAAR